MTTVTSQQIRDMFPREVEITQEIIDSANNASYQNCTGALALKSFLPSEVEIAWANSIGHLNVSGKDIRLRAITVDGKDDVHMMGIRTPQQVKFVLR
jgi:hypothetical protein